MEQTDYNGIKPSSDEVLPVTNDKEESKPIVKKKHPIRSLIFCTLVLATTFYFLFFHIIGITFMPNGDMVPRLDANDLIVYYRLENKLRARDIVVFNKALDNEFRAVDYVKDESFFGKAVRWLGFKNPNDPETRQIVSRIVALPGDTVEITGNHLIVNGDVMIESNIYYKTPEYVGYVNYPLILKDNEYFVMADYRNGGIDSRFFGPVSREEIAGVIITVLRRNNL